MGIISKSEKPLYCNGFSFCLLRNDNTLTTLSLYLPLSIRYQSERLCRHGRAFLLFRRSFSCFSLQSESTFTGSMPFSIRSTITIINPIFSVRTFGDARFISSRSFYFADVTANDIFTSSSISPNTPLIAPLTFTAKKKPDSLITVVSKFSPLWQKKKRT